jgi:cysteine desulfurase
MHIAGLGTACESAAVNLRQHMAEMQTLRDRLYHAFAGVADVQRNGHPEQTLPNTLSVSFKGIEANAILEKIADTVAASAGAACHSGTVRVSHVLKAMEVEEVWAQGTLRFSIGRMTTMEQIDRAAEAVIAAVRETRSRSISKTA